MLKDILATLNKKQIEHIKNVKNYDPELDLVQPIYKF